MPRYKIADVVFDAETIYSYSQRLCQDYLYEGEETPSFSAVMTKEDIEFEKKMAPDYPEPYLESLALFRKLCDYILKNCNGIIFHSSAVEVDGNAYLFAAPSGTGKSTHARLWREMLGDDVVMINDDKPIIRLVDGAFYVYGTPWNGKHHLSTNKRAKIKAICEIRQASKNAIRKAPSNQMLITLLNQTIRPDKLEEMDKLLVLIDKMLKTVDLYQLDCTISAEAAKLSFDTMSKNLLD